MKAKIAGMITFAALFIIALIFCFVDLSTLNEIKSYNNNLYQTGTAIDAELTKVNLGAGDSYYITYHYDDSDHAKTPERTYLMSADTAPVTLYITPDSSIDFPKEPYSAFEILSVRLAVYIPLFLALVFLVLAVIFFYEVRLRFFGKCILAESVYCGKDDRKLNSKKYILRCKIIDEKGNPHTFTSRKVSYNPQSKLYKNEATVYVNPKDYNKYLVDI